MIQYLIKASCSSSTIYQLQDSIKRSQHCIYIDMSYVKQILEVMSDILYCLLWHYRGPPVFFWHEYNMRYFLSVLQHKNNQQVLHQSKNDKIKNPLEKWKVMHPDVNDMQISSYLYVKFWTLSVQNIKNTFLILSCTPFCPQNSINSLGHGLYIVLKSFHRDAGPCWL